MRRGKVGAVAAFELLTTLKRKAYLITTFGMPLILVAYGGVMGGIGMMAGGQMEGEQVFGIVDHSGLLVLEGEIRSSALPEEITDAIEATGQAAEVLRLGTTTLRPYPDADAARAALLEAETELAGYFVIPTDYLESGRIERYLPESINLDLDDSRGAIRRVLLDRLLTMGTDPELRPRIEDPVAEMVSRSVTPDGSVVERQPFALIARMAVPIVFIVLLFVSLMMNTTYLVQGTAEEKENKVVEVLLAAADPEEILAGKLLGLGGAGLLQLLVWFSMIIAAGLLFAGVLAGLGIRLPWASMLLAVPFFLAAYLLFGALMLATGSLGGSYKEAQQLTGVWGLLAAIPMMFLGVLLMDPHGTIGTVLTWIPFSAPVTVLLRLAIAPEGVAVWEIVGTLVVMGATIVLALRVGGRLFRLGLLSGSRPKLREILRQARLG